MASVSIEAALHEAQLVTVAMLKDYVTSASAVQCGAAERATFVEVLAEFTKDLRRRQLGKKPAPKQKKEPSAFNLLIRDKINQLKQEYPKSTGRTGHDLMRMAVAAWKEENAAPEKKPDA